MKTTILSALLFAAFTLQEAGAAVRTFEYTAVVSSAWDTDSGPVIGPDGRPLAAGDTILGRFAFDDLGRDWTGSPADARELDTVEFSVTFQNSGQSFAFPQLKWSHEQTSTGSSFYLSPILLVPSPPPVGLHFDMPPNAAFWELDKGAEGRLSGTWWNEDYSVRSFFSAGVTRISEVSAVPEPATYAMLLLGLGALGAASYRRRVPKA